MDWLDLIKLVPVIAGSVNPLASVLANAMLTFGEQEIERQQQEDLTKTRDEIIAEAGSNFFQGREVAELLRAMGHENEPPVEPVL